MPTAVQKNLVISNEKYASSFTEALEGKLPLPPAKKYLVVTCMDARIDPASAFGINLGDAHVIRNAGGSAKDALRSIVISEQLLGTTEILLVKHTDCGMLTFSNNDAHQLVEKNLGAGVQEELKGLDFLPFPELDQAVKDDLAFLEASRLIPGEVAVSGWVYDVGSGKVRPVA
ncbi:carbonic anhydrase [Viridothelium virens]|uniref:Carbonic anhydrase n=1 Tax=Viridothelium virens TaxID=1048519 RepID=A0A6A6HIA4_VIRVR|nr:carbonic anhydrase [Viridothelium virens]